MKRIFLAINILLLASCGGFNPTFTNAPAETNIVNIDQPADGIWTGTVTKAGATHDVYMLVSGGILIGKSADNKSLYYGTYTVSKSSITGKLNGYENATSFAATDFSGIVAGGKTLRFVTTDNASIDLTYSPDTDKPTTLTDLNASWSFTDGSGNTTTNTIQADGSFYGAAPDGCISTGIIKQDGNYNLYQVSNTANPYLCSTMVAGNHNGIGTLRDTNSDGIYDTIFVMTYNGTIFTWPTFTRN